MSFEVEYFTLTPTDSTNEYISLGGTPIVSNNVALDLIGGTAQALSGDFAVDSTSVRWDSTTYNLNGQLVTGDKLRVIYDKS